MQHVLRTATISSTLSVAKQRDAEADQNTAAVDV